MIRERLDELDEPFDFQPPPKRNTPDCGGRVSPFWPCHVFLDCYCIFHSAFAYYNPFLSTLQPHWRSMRTFNKDLQARQSLEYIYLKFQSIDLRFDFFSKDRLPCLPKFQTFPELKSITIPCAKNSMPFISDEVSEENTNPTFQFREVNIYLE